MTDHDLPKRLATSRPLLIAFLAIFGLLALASAVLFQAPELVGQDKILTDFDAFYVAGTMAGQGHAAETYDASETLAAQRRMTGDDGFMAWTYPPPYTLFVEGLARLPIGLSYLVFVTSTLAFYVFVLWRIAGTCLPGVLVAMLPTFLLTLRTGQNGFLTGALVGYFLLAFSNRRTIAGVPLGLMVLKPHLAAGISLLALLGKRWDAIVLAGGIVAASLLAATGAFGFGIWGAFLGGVREAGEFLAEGYYPLYRMTSVYASVRTFGGSAELALAIHAVVALAAAGMLLRVWRNGGEPRIVAAAACVVSLFVSPYNYDYDLTILGLAIAFVLPDLIERSRSWELAGLLLLLWFATGYGFALVVFSVPHSGPGADDPLSLGAPAVALLVIASSAVLRCQHALLRMADGRLLVESEA